MEYKKINKIRTNLIVEVYNETSHYIKNCKIKFNSKIPKEILKNYDKFQFEKKFDNPIVVGSKSSSSLRFGSDELINSNAPIKKDLPSNYKVEYQDLIHNKQTNNCLDLLEFINKKKISVSLKKLKVNSISEINSSNKRKSSFESYDFSKSSFYSHNNNMMHNLFYDEEKQIKMKILKGYDKLQKIARKLNKKKVIREKINYDNIFEKLPDKRESRKKINSDTKEKEYEEIFELLEYKGINFSSKKNSKNDVCSYLEDLSNKRYSDLSCLKNSNLLSPKIENVDKKRNGLPRYSKKKPSKKSISSSKNIVNTSNNPMDNFKNIGTNIKKSELFSAKAISIKSNKIVNNENNKIKDKQNENDNYSDVDYEYELVEMNTLLKSDLKYANKHSTSNHSKFSTISVTLNEKLKIDRNNIKKSDDFYENYKNNIGSIEIKEIDEDNSPNSCSYSDNQLTPVINLKPVQVASNHVTNYSSISLIDYTSSENNNFVSNVKESKNLLEINKMYGMSENKINPDNYDEYEEYMNKLFKKEENYSTPTINDNESDYATYNPFINSKNSSLLSVVTDASKQTHSFITNSSYDGTY